MSSFRVIGACSTATQVARPGVSWQQLHACLAVPRAAPRSIDLHRTFCISGSEPALTQIELAAAAQQQPHQQFLDKRHGARQSGSNSRADRRRGQRRDVEHRARHQGLSSRWVACCGAATALFPALNTSTPAQCSQTQLYLQQDMPAFTGWWHQQQQQPTQVTPANLFLSLQVPQVAW